MTSKRKKRENQMQEENQINETTSSQDEPVESNEVDKIEEKEEEFIKPDTTENITKIQSVSRGKISLPIHFTNQNPSTVISLIPNQVIELSNLDLIKLNAHVNKSLIRIIK